MSHVEKDSLWWEATWREREDALIQVFGQSQPPGSPSGHVISLSMMFPKDWPSVAIPGACVQVFPPNLSPSPNEVARDFWLYVTTGLSQPSAKGEAWDGVGLARGEETNSSLLSGYGAEFGLIVDAPSDWPADFLRTLMGYVTAEAPVRGGHRIPFSFHRLSDGTLSWVLGDPADLGKTRADKATAILFWPMLYGPGLFTTRTGSFDLLIGTSITSDEWQLAKETSSAHLQLLLVRAEIGQRSIPGRQSLTDDERWMKEWETISTMTYECVAAELSNVGDQHLPR